MVKICDQIYPKANEAKYAEYFDKFPYSLSSFQKYAIEAIVEDNHVLVTAHTGSGKTLPAEFAIEYFVSLGKKVIYTSPIKALSNQKFYEFSKKFPHISFGILTGDIKTNPEADVLIMTAEILQNTLYRRRHNSAGQIEPHTTASTSLTFDMNFETELACVIMDEVHYINDQDRGKAWEETIMMLPLHVQMVMLSATLDKPEKFAFWCENRGDAIANNSKKQVYLATTYERVVPLTHYSFVTCNQGIFKAIGKDDVLKQLVNDVINKTHVIQSSSGIFDDVYFHKMKKTLNLFDLKQVRVTRSHVLNQVSKYMVENGMLPAICFVLSRKQLEVCAKEITVPLLEDDSKVGYNIKRECDMIIRKLPNYQEYLELPEYIMITSLLAKGIGIHHAGIMPVLREMVELLFSKGYIKMLFATETFAVGINMPTKTVLFTDVNKFDGSGMRGLYSHEYSQMSGRAGRRGLDKVGHVVHLNNLFKSVELVDYKKMMCGKPQTLVSKFKVSYHLLMNLIDIGDRDFLHFCQKSMIQGDIDSELGLISKEINYIEGEMELLLGGKLTAPWSDIERYVDCLDQRTMAANKKRKELDREMTSILAQYPSIETDKVSVIKYRQKKEEMNSMRSTFSNTKQYLDSNVAVILEFLVKDGFVEKGPEPSNSMEYTLTTRGSIAVHLREVHCLLFAKLIEDGRLDMLSAKQLIAVFSCFTNVTVADDVKSIRPITRDIAVQKIIEDVIVGFDYYQDFESIEQISTGIDYTIHYELVNSILTWCDSVSVSDCKLVLQDLERTKGIFLGEFVKAILKINNISSEMEKIAENTGNIHLLSKLKEIPMLSMKFVATNQSLYI